MGRSVLFAQVLALLALVGSNGHAMVIELGQLVSFRHNYGLHVESGTPDFDTVYMVIGATVATGTDKQVLFTLEDQASLSAPQYRQVVVRVPNVRDLTQVCALQPRTEDFH